MIELKKYFPNLSQDQLEKFMMLVPIYKDWNSKVNLISRRDIENLFTNHILHSLSIVNIIEFESSTSVLDVGTGGGFPGIPLAIFFPNVKFTLLDSIGKKIKVVESVSKDLSLSNVTAINDRVENHFEKYDFILSRAVAKMDKFYSLVNKNFNSKSINEIPNGIISLKGGDLKDELKDFKEKKIFDISEFFTDDFFKTKRVVYVPNLDN
ncbi:16S rRNA (guanine(527)-N(7))-methyltransferase RsmG [Flavobacteriaceae bacterium]|nr:16S rRNA (guanine(527)-N(7))-methyltransferase RsmG [Flavobacteriaceae bacterium]MDA9160471.1 16S rRNA (guanine(527)-N(7))-methyltransferase RsmG [Flavobacteriaceae bacterium]MDC1009731.1 16S rRNA (guanine(527)-N(7))-methyltransferase RsmG [Flavobacteriaceae bacterium]MDC3297328.1 16S rRNA (guanine(527)-N(7))-methyltransferase RsmG [Flavobacteriaceae bacterium]